MADLPNERFLDEAAQRAGCGSWGIVTATCAEKSALGRSIISNARSLQKLAELEAENAHHQADEATVERVKHAAHKLAMAAGELVVATDSMADLRGKREAVLRELEAYEAAIAAMREDG